MEFGIWIEPEMINPDSDLFRLHPGLDIVNAGIFLANRKISVMFSNLNIPEAFT